MDKRLSIYVSSPDSYSDVLAVFLKGYRRYWSDCPYEFILTTNTKSYEGITCICNNKQNDTWVERTIAALPVIKSKYVMLMCDDIILSEYGTAVVGLEMLRSVNEESAEETRKEHIVQSAISTLSFSELEAIIHIFEELDGTEGILVASKIADRVGITRSVIVNALRKFESAGVIESRSSGMKGTYIKVLNDYVFTELEKIKKERL